MRGREVEVADLVGERGVDRVGLARIRDAVERRRRRAGPAGTSGSRGAWSTARARPRSTPGSWLSSMPLCDPARRPRPAGGRAPSFARCSASSGTRSRPCPSGPVMPSLIADVQRHAARGLHDLAQPVGVDAVLVAGAGSASSGAVKITFVAGEHVRGAGGAPPSARARRSRTSSPARGVGDELLDGGLGWPAARSRGVSPSKPSSTWTSANSGQYVSMGASRSRLPCSTCCSAATVATIFVIDMMRKWVSAVTGSPLAADRGPGRRPRRSRRRGRRRSPRRSARHPVDRDLQDLVDGHRVNAHGALLAVECRRSPLVIAHEQGSAPHPTG